VRAGRASKGGTIASNFLRLPIIYDWSSGTRSLHVLTNSNEGWIIDSTSKRMAIV